MIKVLGTLCGQNPDQFCIRDDGKIVWEDLWKLALRHRVGSVLIDHLDQAGVAVPDNIGKLMSDHKKQNLYKGLRNSAELIRITERFNKHNIPFINFKGIAFNELTGLKLTQRHNGDIDVLLADHNDIRKADKQLRKMGYQRLTLPKTLCLNAKQNQHFLNYEKDIVYIHPHTKTNIELHFKLF